MYKPQINRTTCTKFSLGLSRLHARDPFPFRNRCLHFLIKRHKANAPLKLNEVLSKAAEKQVEVFSRDEAYFDNKKE